MFNPTIPQRPGHHPTLQQELDNPTQAARLPTTSRPTLEHRLRLDNPTVKRQLRSRMLWSITWRLLLVIFVKFIYFFQLGVANWMFVGLIFLGAASVAQGLLYSVVAPLRWFIILFGCVTVALLATQYDRPYYELGIGLVATTLLADRLATHFYLAKTADCRRSARKRWLRLRWRNRLAFWRHPTCRIPGYGIALAVPLGLFVLLLHWSTQPTRIRIIQDLYRVSCAAVVLMSVALLWEPLVAYLYRRAVPSPWRLVRTAFQSLWDWMTYNPLDHQYPAVFQSPTGPIRARRSLFYGTLLLLFVGLLDLSSYIRPPDERLLSPTSAEQPFQEALRRLSKARGEPITASDQDLGELDRMTRFDREYAMPMTARLVSLLTTSAALGLLPIYLLGTLLPSLGRAAATLGPDPQFDDTRELTPDRWHRFVEHLHGSSDPTERSSLFLGMNATDDSPVLVPRRVFQEHAHLLGDTGSGKSALGISPLVSQLIRAGDCSVVLIDLKGDDHALFENARLEAERAGIPFRWFTNELGQPTYAFNPLLQSHLRELSLYQRTDLLTASLGLQYGSDYGRGYFSDANAEMMFHALRAVPNVQSFAELAYVLRQREPFRQVSAQLKTAGAHLAAIVSRLAATEALNVHPGQTVAPEVLGESIDMREAFQRPQVLYFHLSSALGTSTTAEIARMAMFSLLTASKFVTGSRQQVFLIVDEFQRVVSNNLELFLQTARSMNIGVILANQSLSDLKKPDVDIMGTVRTNTRFRQLFSVGEVNDLNEVIATSGESLVHGRSWNETFGLTLSGFAGLLESRITSETISPRLRVNDVLLASDHPLQSIVYVRRGDGYAQFGGLPFVMKSTFHISESEYQTRQVADWPNGVVGTFVPTRASTDDLLVQPSVLVGTQDRAAGGRQTVAGADDGVASESESCSAAAKRLFDSLDQHYQDQLKGRNPSPDRRDGDAPPAPGDGASNGPDTPSQFPHNSADEEASHDSTQSP